MVTMDQCFQVYSLPGYVKSSCHCISAAEKLSSQIKANLVVWQRQRFWLWRRLIACRPGAASNRQGPTSNRGSLDLSSPIVYHARLIISLNFSCFCPLWNRWDHLWSLFEKSKIQIILFHQCVSKMPKCPSLPAMEEEWALVLQRVLLWWPYVPRGHPSTSAVPSSSMYILSRHNHGSQPLCVWT